MPTNDGETVDCSGRRWRGLGSPLTLATGWSGGAGGGGSGGGGGGGGGGVSVAVAIERLAVAASLLLLQRLQVVLAQGVGRETLTVVRLVAADQRILEQLARDQLEGRAMGAVGCEAVEQ